MEFTSDFFLLCHLLKCNVNRHLLPCWTLFFYSPFSSLKFSDSLTLPVIPCILVTLFWVKWQTKTSFSLISNGLLDVAGADGQLTINAYLRAAIWVQNSDPFPSTLTAWICPCLKVIVPYSRRLSQLHGRVQNNKMWYLIVS